MTAPQFRLRLADFPESGYATEAVRKIKKFRPALHYPESLWQSV
jgi:outer membrane protein assembly factor BamD (BamD/ComL family)